MKKRVLDFDFIALLLIVLGGFFLYNKNNVGWFFIVLGILKNVLDRR